MKKLEQDSLKSDCPHKNTINDGGFLVCQDCGLIFEENVDFEMPVNGHYGDSQIDYERNLRIRDKKAIQDPIIKQKYSKLQLLDKWYRDYETSFIEQKRTLELLKLHDVNISAIQFMQIKKRYLTFNRKHRKSYQNMVIIFLGIVWLVIKDTSTIHVEKYIATLKKLWHRINKKMLNNAMERVKRTEQTWNKYNTPDKIEEEIKNRIKVIFQKDLNNIDFDMVREYIADKSAYEKLKIEMQLLAADYLNKISYEQLKNLNYKAYTAGLIYYIGQTLSKERRKIFTQSLIEEATNFSTTTIRKKYHVLKEILGTPSVKNNPNAKKKLMSKS